MTSVALLLRAGASGSAAKWRCICDCGQSKDVVGKSLRHGMTKSCGCLAREKARDRCRSREFREKMADALTRHGHKRKGIVSPEYRTWLQIKRRCTDKSDSDFSGYGARGIRVCPEWSSSFERFLSDMGEKPSSSSVLRRKDTSAGYDPGNCEWSTPHEVVTGRRRGSIPVVIGGLEFPTMAAACRYFGVSKTTALYRVKNGIALEDAVAYAPGSQKPRRSRESYLPHGHPDRRPK